MAVTGVAGNVGQYNNPGTTESTIGGQINESYYWKLALIEAAKEQYFSPLADVVSMPKNYGKKIKKYHYLPLLDDRNMNDQGLDAAGAVYNNGNLYGSSKDVGTISSKLPTLSETGGRVNRVGFTRVTIEGSLEKMGFFSEYTQESLDFDTDAELYQHMSREMIIGANEINEDALQVDLLNSAGVVRFGGVAAAASEIIGEGSHISVVTYKGLQRLAITLVDNRTPKQTRVIKGSRMTDTMTVSDGFVMHIGSELQPLIEDMQDAFDNQAFIPVRKYADAGNILNGEIGAVGQFRIVVVPEMQHWAGAGATATAANAGYRTTSDKYDVFPMLVIGAESFTTIGFQTSGSSAKFKIITKMPGEQTADRNDPYGEKGFASIKWYYGFMPLRTERMAVYKTVAPL